MPSIHLFIWFYTDLVQYLILDFVVFSDAYPDALHVETQYSDTRCIGHAYIVLVPTWSTRWSMWHKSLQSARDYELRIMQENFGKSRVYPSAQIVCAQGHRHFQLDKKKSRRYCRYCRCCRCFCYCLCCCCCCCRCCHFYRCCCCCRCYIF
jgi:hypothetical protein